MSTIRKWPSGTIALVFFALALFLYAERGAKTQFAQNNYAGTSTGTANAQVITVPNIGSYDDILNQEVVFTAGGGLSNTAPMTLNASGLGVRNVYRVVPFGVVSLGGGEVVAGMRVKVMWDGTQFQLLNSANPAVPGTVIDYANASCPTGFFQASSQTLSQATYPVLFSVLGSTWGSSGGGNFTTPDLRNRTTYGLDVNVGGFSNRITVAGGNYNGQTLGAAGSRQNYTLAIGEIPSFNPSSAITPFQATGQVSTANIASGSLSGTLAAGNFGVKVVTGSTFATAGGTAAGIGDSGLALSDSRIFNFVTDVISVSGTSIGGGAAHPVLSSGAIINKCVRA